MKRGGVTVYFDFQPKLTRRGFVSRGNEDFADDRDSCGLLERWELQSSRFTDPS